MKFIYPINKNRLSKVKIVLFVIIFTFSINVISLIINNNYNNNSNNSNNSTQKENNLNNDIHIKLIQKPNDLKEISEKKYQKRKYIDILIHEERLKECEHVDLVYTWVNGSDPKHFAEKEKILGISNYEPHRYRDYGGLKYSLRSQLKYAPWINNVYVVTAQQIPTWFNVNEPGNVKFIFHNQLYANKSHLPTYNSNSIESNFWNLPEEVSNCFLYLNDDIFFRNPVERSDYFVMGGDPVLYEGNDDVSSDYNDGKELNAYTIMFKHANQQLDKVWNENKKRSMVDHGIQVFKKSIWKLMNEQYAEQLANTSSHRTRTPYDTPVSFVSNVFTKKYAPFYYNAPRNLNVYAGIWNSLTNDYKPLENAFKKIKSATRAKTVCVNDGFEFVDDIIANKITSMYEEYFPDKAIHEL